MEKNEIPTLEEIEKFTSYQQIVINGKVCEILSD
jgi:hypothetical protein